MGRLEEPPRPRRGGTEALGSWPLGPATPRIRSDPRAPRRGCYGPPTVSDASDPTRLPPALRRVFEDPPPGRVMGRGHRAGDLLHAYEWELLERGPGRLRVRCPLPEGVLNPSGHLFGGFTGTYVDLLSLLTWRAAQQGRRQGWLMTLNMRIDYLEPVTGSFEAECEIVSQRGRNAWVQSRFRDPENGTLLVLALTTLREIDEA